MISPLKLLLSSILLVVVGKLQAENVFYNGSFELGKCGYSILRNYRPASEPFRLDFRPGSGFMKLIFMEFRLK